MTGMGEAKGWRRTKGSRTPEPGRFFAKVDRTDASGCWIWTGARVSKGYGSFRAEDQSTVAAHRWIWEARHGSPIPPDLEVDHVCFNRACVNPEHLELVTHRENVNRGQHNQNHGKPECVRGHAFDAANTSIDLAGKRVCRACARARTRRYREQGVVA